MKKYKAKTGFSLIELMVTLAIALFMISCTMVTYHSLDRTIVRAELFFFKLFCQKVRSDAVATGTTQAIEIDAATHSYRSSTGINVKLPRQVRFGVPAGTLGPPSDPTTPIVQSVNFKDNRIICYPTGNVSAGIVYVTNQEKFFTYALSNGVGILSSLRLYRNDKEKWKVIE